MARKKKVDSKKPEPGAPPSVHWKDDPWSQEEIEAYALSTTIAPDHAMFTTVSDEELKDATDSSHPKTRYIMACENLIFRMLIVVEPDRSIRDAAFSDDPLP